MIRYLTTEQVLRIHRKMLERYGGAVGVRDPALLESAVVRPRLSAFGKDAYPTLFRKAAVLLHSLVKNHPFVDGNKRTGFAAMHLMLLLNGYDVTSTTVQEVSMTLHVAEGKTVPEQIESWIEKYGKER